MDYSSYSYFAATPQPYAFPSKQEHPSTPQDDLSHDPIDTYTNHPPYSSFDHSSSYHHYIPNPLNTIVQPQSPPHSTHSFPTSTTTTTTAAPLLSEPSTTSPHEIPQQQGSQGDSDTYDQTQGGRSSDEDKESITPAQNRRKAQNRAAQRAFRERKERRVKELEIKLKRIEDQSSTLLTDNERLKRELEKLATQNEILRASNSLTMTTAVAGMQQNNHNHNQQQQQQNHPHHHHHHHHQQRQHALPSPSSSSSLMLPESPISGPHPSTFHTALSAASPAALSSHHGLQTSDSSVPGERLLSAGATWDFIINHELSKKGMVDVGGLYERLKDRALCNGMGPAFAESEIEKAIEESVGGAGDELIWRHTYTPPLA